MSHRSFCVTCSIVVLFSLCGLPHVAAEPPLLDAALDRAGDNRAEIERAIAEVPTAQQEGMQFLIGHMPDRDLQTLSADFLLENVHLAYDAWESAPWRADVPKEIFLNNILPYANVTEQRDRWRRDFRERFAPLVKDAPSPGRAAAILNQQIFSILNVRYSTQRAKPDQSPFESMQSGLASCTGLSILLIDACRAVGVPARLVGTPLWSDRSGNHSWVEVWDRDWHFTGAAEPAGDELNQAWFVGRAATSRRDDPLHAIYAVSFQRTPSAFPMVWDRRRTDVWAVNVTDRYTRNAQPLPDGQVAIMFRVLARPGGDRQAAELRVSDAAGATVFAGTTKDERFDANDHLTIALGRGEEYQVEARHDGRVLQTALLAEERTGPVTLLLSDTSPGAHDAAEPTAEASPVQLLRDYLQQPEADRPPLAEQPFSRVSLTREEAAEVEQLLWQDHVARIRQSRQAEMEARELVDGERKMPFFYRVFGDRPEAGRSLYISMHGGGGAPPAVNDRQWENQKRLYQPQEGVYLAPRAPTNTWNLWHEAHIDRMFDRLIENLIVWEDVDPDRVYLMGYSAGGDGVFQLAPRMADRWAAAAMMAGHPNETSPLGLRNLPFALYMGGRDEAYGRNQVARQWEQQLADLRAADPEGYVHQVQIYPDKGHWMDREDASALPWMAQFRRNPLPTRIVWKQDDVTHSRFYWLAVEPVHIRDRAEIIAQRNGQTVDVRTQQVDRLTVRLNDQMVDLDQPVTITRGEQTLFHGHVPRTIALLARTLNERGDPRSVFSGEVAIELASP